MNSKTITNMAVRSIITMMLKSENDDWPPKCSTILFQPKRPKMQKIRMAVNNRK